MKSLRCGVLWLGLLLVFTGGSVQAQGPTIVATTQARQVVTAGENLTLGATVLNATSYQWLRSGRPIAGATAATYLIASAESRRDNGWYQVVATNASGSTTSRPIFVLVAPRTPQVVAWGDNTSGQTTLPNGLTDVVAVSAGFSFGLALRRDGTVTGWGSNNAGQLDIPSSLNDVVAIAAGNSRSFALRSDGTLVGWGAVVLPADDTDIVALSADSHLLAVKTNGTVVAAGGQNSFNQLNVPAGLSNVIAVAAHGNGSLALKADGTVVSWGSNLYGQAQVPSSLNNVVAIANSDRGYALRADGATVFWGSGLNVGQTRMPAGLTGVAAIDAKSVGSMALMTDGTVRSWGTSSQPPAGLDQVVAIAMGDSFMIALRDATVPTLPTIVQQPASLTLLAGQSGVLSVTATSSASLFYQWRKDGVPIAGATGPTLPLTTVRGEAAGTYLVVISNAGGSVTSAAVTLTVLETRLVNVSVRSRAGTGDQTLIVGFAIAGTGVKQLLLRGVGPGLTPLGIAGAIADPQLRLFSQAGVQLRSNDDWGVPAGNLAEVSAQLGAFALAPGSRDAAMLASLAVGSQSAHITSTGAEGVAILEVYDADSATALARLSNLSARSQVGTGENLLVAGFVLRGNTPKRLLLRAAGPALTQFNLANVLLRPQLTLYSGTTPLAQNAGWSTSADATAIAAAARQVNAFPFGSFSLDAALLAELPPGGYTVQVSGLEGTTGLGLVEIYELP